MAADVLVHVVDASAPNASAQRASVLQVLRQLGVQPAFLQQRVLEVWNKADLLDAGRARRVVNIVYGMVNTRVHRRAKAPTCAAHCQAWRPQ